MRDLQWITGSVARARIVTHVLLNGSAMHSISGLAEGLSLRRTAVEREVERLLATGFLRRAPFDGKYAAVLYEVDPDQAGLPDLRRYVQLNLGEASIIRDAVMRAAPRSLAWLHGPYAAGLPTARVLNVVVLTSDPRAVKDGVSVAARHLPLFRMTSDVMSLKEWTYRLERREFRALRLRRAQRMWLVGSDEELRRAEDSEISARRTWKAAIANWREELSDEWDEDWDPFAPFPVAPR